ncbi:Tex-like N-terminal domain-containing protein [[Mycoplasma] gypis]|uniref:Tex family protein n=1 Tax=[Mycoplasma] gypis TaxID=92404 RepID=A0ABZ2RND2_9BACT|nr:Tex family protein [[Mycoplasma] gypis]MBN0919356.1 RNA-binding transcriptional accessory protein [[Mycoplasma] gypis]
MNLSIEFVAKKMQLKEEQVEVVLNFLSEGATVPFISRYRKNVTGGLDEEQIEEIDKLYKYNTELNKRKDAIIEILTEKQLLTDDIKQKILLAETKQEVENIYEPFKVGKKTKATEAIALGLEPLAKEIFEQQNPKFNPYQEARKYLNDKISSEEFAIEQAKYIISQWISQDIDTRNYVKNQILNFGFIVTKIKKNAKDEKETYKDFYDYKIKVSSIQNHRILAIQRAENEKIVSYDFEYNLKKITYDLNNKFFKIKTTGKIISESILDALDRLILPSIEREIKSDLFDKAQKAAIELFSKNLEDMLLAPAVKNKTILALDPAYVNGCKIAVISKTGQVLEVQKIYPNPPKNQIKESADVVLRLINKHSVDIVVIGNGTASRETETFIAKLIKQAKLENIYWAIVSEVGASVYSASKGAIKEFPDLSVEERSAINIGRKFQDPLNELVKIDPKSIGVGQYQHDVNQKELSEALTFKVNKVVNQVGVDINTATEEILTYVSGLSAKTAANIVLHREENGRFVDRKQIKDVKGLGAKTYEQAIGFMRIHDSKNFYDRTQIHPESYKLADKIVKELNIDLNNIDTENLKKINKEELAQKLDSNKYDIELILEAFINPTKDIRDSKEGLLLRQDVLDINQIKKGDVFEGNVENITDFGAFVYIGIKQSALVHISQMSDKKILHPSEVLSVGQKVKIEILDIDIERSRISAKLIY